MSGLGGKLYAAAIVAASIVAMLVVYINQANGFYKTESDSISIPVFLIALVALVLFFLAVLQLPLCLKVRSAQIPSLFAVIFSLLSTVCSLFFISVCMLYWYIPSHFFSFWVYVLVAVFYLRFQIKLYRAYFLGRGSTSPPLDH